jgi:hypothetical protein
MRSCELDSSSFSRDQWWALVNKLYKIRRVSQLAERLSVSKEGHCCGVQGRRKLVTVGRRNECRTVVGSMALHEILRQSVLLMWNGLNWLGMGALWRNV